MVEPSARVLGFIRITWTMLIGTGFLLAAYLRFRDTSLGIAMVLLLIGSIIGFAVLVHESRDLRKMEYGRFRELFTSLSDGIIVMDPNRSIVYTNPAAVRMTGWNLSDTVPYCRYCQERQLAPGEQRCLLAQERDRSYFESQLPTRTEGWVTVGMSRTFLMPQNDSRRRDMVITIRDVTLEQQEEELRLTRRLTHQTWKVQEEERKRLSQELHDGVSQSLYAVNLGLGHLAKHIDTPKLSAKIRELQQQMDTSIEEVRALSKTLYPAVLYSLGLVAALQTFAETMTNTNLIVSYITNIPSDTQVPPETAVHIYRIVQEATHNAVLHGLADFVLIQLNQENDIITLDIHDNGIGFRPESQDFTGYGLRNMQERARAIGSPFAITSHERDGTQIHLVIPMPWRKTLPASNAKQLP